MSKKVFVLALSALLIVAFAATAIAETKVSFSGFYRVRGFYKNNYILSDQSADESKSSYFDHRFQFGAKFMPTDALTLTIRGRSDNNGQWGTTPGNRDQDSFYLDRVFMTIKTGFGAFNVGRQTGYLYAVNRVGAGLSPIGQDRLFLDRSGAADQIGWNMKAGNFGIGAYYEKSVEAETVTGESDGDSDIFAVIPTFSFANGRAAVVMEYRRDHTGFDKIDDWFINPAVAMNFGPFGLVGSFAFLSGKQDVADRDREGTAFYVEGSYNYGAGTVGLAYAYLQGDDDLTDNKDKGLITSGSDYVPLVMLTDNWACNFSNNWHTFLWVDHSLTEDLMLHAVIGYMQIVEPGKKLLNPAEDASKDMGTEFDLGLTYKIMKNLDYKAIVGYFVPGDFMKDTTGATDLGNAYLLKHELRLNF